MTTFPKNYQRFTAAFYDGSFDDFGIEGTAARAAGFGTVEERQELLAFFRKAREDRLPPHKLEELWWKGESPYIMSRETIGAFFDMIVGKLETSLRDPGKRRA